MSAVGVKRLLPQAVHRAKGPRVRSAPLYRTQHRKRGVPATIGNLDPAERFGALANGLHVP